MFACLAIEFDSWADLNDVKQENRQNRCEKYTREYRHLLREKEQAEHGFPPGSDPLQPKCRPSKVPRFNSINTGASLAKIHRDPARGEPKWGFSKYYSGVGAKACPRFV